MQQLIIVYTGATDRILIDGRRGGEGSAGGYLRVIPLAHRYIVN